MSKKNFPYIYIYYYLLLLLLLLLKLRDKIDIIDMALIISKLNVAKSTHYRHYHYNNDIDNVIIICWSKI